MPPKPTTHWCAKCAKDSNELCLCFAADLQDALPCPANVLNPEHSSPPSRGTRPIPSEADVELPPPTSSEAGASAIERLPIDILRDILLSIPFSTTDRLALRAVSRGFRNAVEHLPSFWARIHVETARDLAHLDATLLWSDPAPLHITVLDSRKGSFRRTASDYRNFDEGLTARLLAPQFRRMVFLHLVLLNTLSMAPLLSCDLCFDELEELEISCSEPCGFSLSATRVRHLSLTRTAPRAWASIVSSNLKSLYLIQVPSDRATQTCICEILTLCPGLSRLWLHLRNDAVTAALQPHLWPRPRLSWLRLDLPLPQLVAALQSLPLEPVGFIYATATGEEDSNALVDAAITCLVAGAERLEFCEGTARLLSASRTVILDLEETWPEESETRIWRAVRASCPSLTTLVVRAEHWYTWARALDEYPADMQDLVLCVDVGCFDGRAASWEDRETGRDGGTDVLPQLQCPALVCVCLQCDCSGPLAYRSLERAVLRAAGGAIATAQPAADVCVCEVLGRLRECSSCAFELLAHALARLHRGQTSGTLWRMCAHDASGNLQRTIKAQIT